MVTQNRVLSEAAGLSAGALVYFAYTLIDNGLDSLLHLYAPTWNTWWATLIVLYPFSVALLAAWSRARARPNQEQPLLIVQSAGSLFTTVIVISLLIGRWHPSFQPDKSLWTEQDWKFFGNLSLFSGILLMTLGIWVAKIFTVPKGKTITL